MFFLRLQHTSFVEISNDIWMQIVVSAAGIALMTALAYYRSWSRRSTRSLRGLPREKDERGMMRSRLRG